MEPLAKRRRLLENASSDANQLIEASQCHRNHTPESNHFEGYGIQNSGSLEIGRDVNILNFSTRSSATREDDMRQVLLDSLRFDQMDARQLSIKKAHAYTCRWFLKTPLYANWAHRDTPHNDHNFLWIRGKPGAGKSTLMKFLLGQLRNQIRQAKSDEILISFFFNARGHTLEKTTTGLYQSLLLQLLEARPDLQYVLEKVRVGHRWTVESLKSLFEEAIQALGDIPTVFLIDALDECEEAQIRDMVSFLTDLSITKDQFHICFASRHYPHITVRVGLSIVLEDHMGHKEDIASYLSNALLIGHSQLAEQIRCDLQDKASGVFMWVVLVVDMLNKEYDAGRVHALHAQIQRLPTDLHALFLDILTRGGHSTHGTLLCIQWVLFARQPLTPKQLYFAILSGLEPHSLAQCHSDEVSEDNIKRYILNNSKGLAESTKSISPTIQFIHESVRDFLLKEYGLSRIWPELSENLFGQSHDRLKQCCLRYMNMKAVVDLKDPSRETTINRFPFLEYANHEILHHSDQAQDYGVDQRDFLAAFPRSKWIRDYNIFQKYNARHYTPKASLLYILAEAGTPALIRAYPNRQSCFEVEAERYGLPILAAAVAKNSAAFQTMLELQCERVSECSFADIYSQLPSSLDNPGNSVRNWVFRTKKGTLHQLIQFGNEKASLLFLATGKCDIDSKDNQGMTALIHATAKKYSILMKVLFQLGADVSAATNNGDTPLHVASHRGHVEIDKLLIRHGADVSAAANNGDTPLHVALQCRRVEIAKLLISHGADISAASNDGDTPLHVASHRGHVEIAKLLVSHGADVSAVANNGDTPLHKASHRRHVEIAKLLISHSADISAANNNGDTPLHKASLYGYVEIVKLLISHGADISAVANNGDTPLHKASLYGHVKVSELLISHRANISVANSNINTPLYQPSVTILTALSFEPSQRIHRTDGFVGFVVLEYTEVLVKV